VSQAGRDGQPWEGEADEVTHDTLLRGRIQLFQPARGFRSSLDPVLLAWFIRPPYGQFLDIGSGTGALSFLLLARDPTGRGVGVEVQPPLAALLARGVEANNFGGRFEVITGDVRQAAIPSGSFDLVVSNPPFQPVGSGELPPDEQKRVAHHEVKLRLDECLARAAELARPDARVAVVLPASRLAELQAGLRSNKLAPVRMRLVHPRAGAPATRVLVEARRTDGKPTLALELPLHVHEGDGYSAEVRRMLGEDDPPGPAGAGEGST
jgi:tRNA1Val (adenine37-N6)-methyltransferase